MATANGFVIPNSAAAGNSSTTFTILYFFVIQDGVQQPFIGNEYFTYDATLTPAANLAAFKAAVAALGVAFGFALDVSNILIFTAVT